MITMMMRERLKKLLHDLEFSFDYYIGYMLTNATHMDRYSVYMMNKYPDKYENEIKFMKEKGMYEGFKEQVKVFGLGSEMKSDDSVVKEEILSDVIRKERFHLQNS